MHTIQSVALLIFLLKFVSPYDISEGCVFLTNDSRIDISLSSKACKGEENVLAEGRLTHTINETGWLLLNITSVESKSDELQAYGAGYFEGYTTKEYILAYVESNPLVIEPKTKVFLENNLKYIYQQISLKGDIDDYWRQVNLIMYQIAGMQAGYSGFSGPLSNTVSATDLIWLLVVQEDIGNINAKYNLKNRDNVNEGRCSSLIKIVDDDLFFSHTTWSEFQTMIRLIKSYKLNFHMTNSKLVPATQISMSSYPGIIESIDDFYITNQKIALMETTNGFYNNTLYEYIVPQSLPFGLRVVVSLRLASTAAEWSQYFGEQNMGTYNCQWMCADYKQLKPGEEMTGLLYILEQNPGQIVAKDMTDFLTGGPKYWSSYNIPFFPSVYDNAGFQEQYKENGNFFSHSECPRARIFRRNVTDVVDLDSNIALMRYNNFQHDPLAICDCKPLPYSGENGIAARSDLNPSNQVCKLSFEEARCHGATDLKVVNQDMMNKVSYKAISGPTRVQQPVFDWSTTEYGCKGVPHNLQPVKFDFDYIITEFEQ